MKQKKINKKLLLSKVTVVNLNNLEMKGVHGGEDTNPDVCTQLSVCYTGCYTCPETCFYTCTCPHPTNDPTHCVTC